MKEAWHDLNRKKRKKKKQRNRLSGASSIRDRIIDASGRDWDLYVLFSLS